MAARECQRADRSARAEDMKDEAQSNDQAKHEQTPREMWVARRS